MPTATERLQDARARLLRGGNQRLRAARATLLRVLRPFALRAAVLVASGYRRLLRRTTFIGVTGSCGKTTSKDMIHAVLSTQHPGTKNRGTGNVLNTAIRVLLSTRPSHGFCVQEFGEGGLGEAIPMDQQYRMFGPSIGVVTAVGDDHIDALGSREAIADAIGTLISALPADGTAILNADDPLVLGLRDRCKGRTITYGLSPEAMVRGDDVRDDWPNRLSLTVTCGDESVRVQTQICGAQLVPSVLSAIAVGHAQGVSLAAAAEALGRFEPVVGRMFPIEARDGVTFIRDDVKAPVWTIPPTLDYLRRADAKRKIVIMGNLSDYQKPLDPTYAGVARDALTAADHVLFVGRWASRALKAKRHPDDDAVRAFVSVEHLNGFLRDFLEPGDLVLIKGSRADRLARIISAWNDATGRADAAPAGDDASARAASATPEPDGKWIGAGATQLVVGLGNPGLRFQQTPHNVGQRALDLVAEQHNLAWSTEAFGIAARARIHDQEVLLVKPSTEMNRTGGWLVALAERAGLRPADCLVLHDDINLKPGVVRNKLAGSSGGHKGMQSIIDEFQTEDVRRVKIGVGKPDDGASVSDYVLSPVAPELATTIETACRQAADRVADMVRKHPLEMAERS